MTVRCSLTGSLFNRVPPNKINGSVEIILRLLVSQFRGAGWATLVYNQVNAALSSPASMFPLDGRSAGSSARHACIAAAKDGLKSVKFKR